MENRKKNKRKRIKTLLGPTVKLLAHFPLQPPRQPTPSPFLFLSRWLTGGPPLSVSGHTRLVAERWAHAVISSAEPRNRPRANGGGLKRTSPGGCERTPRFDPLTDRPISSLPAPIYAPATALPGFIFSRPRLPSDLV